MLLPENYNQILKLSSNFYNAYPNPPYTEILKKEKEVIIDYYFKPIMIILFTFPIEVM